MSIKRLQHEKNRGHKHGKIGKSVSWGHVSGAMVGLAIFLAFVQFSYRGNAYDGVSRLGEEGAATSTIETTVFTGCVEDAESSHYDCTPLETRIFLYELAKTRGIEWSDTRAKVVDETPTSSTGGQYKVIKIYRDVPTTAYTSRPEETDDTPFITADGSHVRDGIVAANFLKFGTKIRLPEIYGDKVFEVHDRMNKRYNVKVDIWMNDLSAAYKHGTKSVTVEVIESSN